MATLSNIITPTNVLTATSTATVTNKTIDGASNTLSNLPGTARFQEFTSSGTWTKPAGVSFVMVEAWGGGGGGGSGRRGAAGGQRSGGSGGGGGGYAYRLIKATDLGPTVSVTVGAGGNGGAARTTDTINGENGTAGGSSLFGSFLTVGGGSAGSGGTNGTVLGGAGGGVFSNGGPTVTSAAGHFGSSSGANLLTGFGGGYGGVNGLNAGNSYQGGNGGGGGGDINSANNISSSGAGGAGLFGSLQGGGAASVFFVGQSGNDGVTFKFGGSGGSGGTVTATGNGRSMCFGNGVFAFASDPYLYTSSETGTDNFALKVVPPNVTAAHMLHDGTKFVIFTPDLQRIFTTVDFVSYTEVSIISGPPSQTVIDVKYVNNRYFVVGGSALWQSTDLTNWSQVDTSFTTSPLRDICWTGTNYVLVFNNGARYSPDLSGWVASTGWSSTFNIVCASNGAGTVVIHNSLAPHVYRSTDHGVTFSAASTTVSYATSGYSLAFVNNLWLLAANGSIWSSTDGNTWTSRDSGSGLTFGPSGIAYSGSAYAVVVSGTGTNAIRRSADLITWTTVAKSPFSLAAGRGGHGGNSGGGGGGGGSLNGFNSGAGGNGGDGLVRVYAW
jgi:hypothetical protein